MDPELLALLKQLQADQDAADVAAKQASLDLADTMKAAFGEGWREGFAGLLHAAPG